MELTGEVRPAKGLSLWGNLAYTHARYDDYVTQTGLSFDGNTPPNIAAWVANGGGSYRFADLPVPVEIGGTVNLGGDRYATDANSVTMPGYVIGDVYAFIDLPESVLPPDTATRLALRIKNVGDKDYAAFGDPFYPNQVFLGTPRTYEASLSFRF